MDILSMYDEIKNNLNNLLQGAKIVKIFRALDLICFKFILQDGRNFSLHAQCLVRVFDSDGVLVICSQNLYRRSPNYKKKIFKKFNWHKLGTTLFDYSLNEYQEKLFETEVTNAIFDDKDTKIKFANGMYMDVLIITTKYDDPDYCEDYRIFGENENEKHYTVPFI